MGTQIQFMPWVGSSFLEGFGGKRIMVLGESHYCDKPEDGTADITIRIIDDFCDENSEYESYKNTYTKFERALAGRKVSSTERRSLWNRILFYNFIQEPMTAARVAPTAQQVSNAQYPFFEVIERYRPDIILVWGRRLYDMLPSQGTQGENVVVDGVGSEESWVYKLSDGHEVRALSMYHPASAFSWEYWHCFIKQLIAGK
ncbi:MAG: hypothetical protein ACRCZY_09640 [Phocaeicola sp.]